MKKVSKEIIGFWRGILLLKRILKRQRNGKKMHLEKVD